METIIRRASIADKAAIWNFIKGAYGDFSKHILPKRWTWQYRENPYVKKEKNLPRDPRWPKCDDFGQKIRKIL